MAGIADMVEQVLQDVRASALTKLAAAQLVEPFEPTTDLAVSLVKLASSLPSKPEDVTLQDLQDFLANR